MQETPAATNTLVAHEEYVSQPIDSVVTAWQRFYSTNLWTIIKLALLSVAAFIVVIIGAFGASAGSIIDIINSIGGWQALMAGGQQLNEAQMRMLMEAVGVGALVFVLGQLLLLLPLSIAIDYVGARAQNLQAAGVMEAWKRGYRRLLTAIGTYVLAGLAVVAGLILLIIPGFYLILRFLYIGGILANENTGPLATLKRSWELSRSNLWDIVGVLSIVIIAASTVSILSASLYNLNTNEGYVLIVAVVFGLVSLVIEFAGKLGLLFRYHQSDLQKQATLTKTGTHPFNYTAPLIALLLMIIDGTVNNPNT